MHVLDTHARGLQICCMINSAGSDLELEEDGVPALGRGDLLGAQHQSADGGLHEQLLEHRIHVARRAAVLQAHKAALLPALISKGPSA
jgi:hypothetical protein